LKKKLKATENPSGARGFLLLSVRESLFESSLLTARLFVHRFENDRYLPAGVLLKSGKFKGALDMLGIKAHGIEGVQYVFVLL
jgi:hypothetical protein